MPEGEGRTMEKRFSITLPEVKRRYPAPHPRYLLGALRPIGPSNKSPTEARRQFSGSLYIADAFDSCTSLDVTIKRPEMPFGPLYLASVDYVKFLY